jgi:hypothetical protein
MADDAELTPAAKEAIRSYMIKFAIPSAVVLTIVSGVFGYVVNGLARIEAVKDTLKDTVAAAEAAAEAKATAAVAAADAAGSRTRATEAATKAEETQTYLLTVRLQTDKILTGQYGEFAKALFALPGFREAVGTINEHTIGDLNAKYDALNVPPKLLTTPEVKATPIATGPMEANTKCPDGTLIVGYYCEVRSGAGYLQSIGYQGNNNFGSSLFSVG